MATATEPACEVLRGCVARYRANRERLEALLDGTSQEAARRRPAPDAWSAVECLEHLRVTAALYRPLLEGAIRKGRERGITGEAPYGRGTFIGRFLLGVLDPERATFKPVKAPGTFRPTSSSLDLDTVARGLRAENEHLEELARSADGLDLGRLRLATPISSLLRVSLDQAFRILGIHDARHLDQAERAMSD